MALATLHVQCSYAPSRPLSPKTKINSKQVLAAFSKVKNTDDILLKHTQFLSITIPPIHRSKRKSIKSSSFKGGIPDSKEILYDTPEVQNVQSPVTFEPNGTIAGSIAVHNLFRSWLTLLRMPTSPHQVVEGTLEGPFLNQIVESEHKILKNGRFETLKMVWYNFLGLHAAVKISAMIFIPMYLAVNMNYGVAVVKELTPLWIGGPLIVALYLTMIQVITSLYIFSFNQSIKMLKKSSMAYDYVVCGKMNETIRIRLWKPVFDFWNLGYVESSRRIRKEFQMWVVDTYMDYVESVWPSYCKLIRFLKRANFI